MKRTLYLKFLIAYLIFGFFGFIIVSTFTYKMIEDKLKDETATQMYNEASVIASTYAADLYNNEISRESVKKQLDALAAFSSSSIWIINPSGRVILTTDHLIDDSNIMIITGFDPSKLDDKTHTVGNFYNTFDEDVLSVFQPIVAGYRVQGYLIIHVPYRVIINRVDSLTTILYMTLAILLVLSMIILYFFTEIVYRPLRKITNATMQYASGNYHYPLQIDSSDEMGFLAASLSYMADEIAKNEDNQKKLVANVSHDFRSPLTSIRGYLEAMLDGTIPPENYEKYLTIVLNETERLTKLTNSLLTLNNLNTAGTVLELSDFDINQVIRNSVASFESVCKPKNISIKLVLTGDTMYVHADISKIQQVLYNLIDNAIKFSNKDSSIKIETSEKGSKLFVSVRDYGVGIPKESLNLIWNRFYKTDTSRGRDKKGTGLGLSITKEIIRSHNENINVISTEGVGTEFIFTLQKSEKEDE